jgi:hypothetical protein
MNAITLSMSLALGAAAIVLGAFHNVLIGAVLLLLALLLALSLKMADAWE